MFPQLATVDYPRKVLLAAPCRSLLPLALFRAPSTSMFRPLCLAVALTAAGFLPAQGQTAITDLGTGNYLGQYQGGLYPGGVNIPPPAHRAAGHNAASMVVPRDRFGVPSTKGFIGFASISMSNANQEWAAFKRRADQDDHRNSRVVLVSGAQGGQSLDVIADPNAPYWPALDARIDAAGLSKEQVQVVWLKMADANPTTLAFPNHALNAKANAVKVLHILKSRYPNLAIAFFSSRSYGGYAAAANRSEPLSYETGFATKWLIEDQIAGSPNLNYDPLLGPVVAPLALWGPYLWTNGPIPRADGLVWLPSDLEADMVHPSAAGEAKIAHLMEVFFHSAPASTAWYGMPVSERLQFLNATDDAWVDVQHPSTNYGAEYYLLVMPGRRLAYLQFDLSNLRGQVERAELCFKTDPEVLSEPGLKVHRVDNRSWSESTLTFANAPTLQGLLRGPLPEFSPGTAVSVDVTAEVLASLGGHVSFALTGALGPLRNKLITSHEGGEPPRLILTIRPACEEPGVPYCRNTPNSSGHPGLLTVTGSTSLGRNNLTLNASQLPPGEQATFFFGFASDRQPVGDGFLCVASPLGAIGQTVVSNNLGQAKLALDFAPLGFLAGQVIYVQCTYRDRNGGLAGYNFTDGLLLTLCP
jgi:hypothetical protein